MLYKNKEPFTQQEFNNPTAEYRGTPFWAWNCELKEDELLRQIDVFKQMGMGGFHMHSRTGLSTPYLGEDFMSMVKSCNEKAKKEDMLCWLYDEDRWPSGSCGGIVTKDISFAQRHLLFAGEKQDGFADNIEEFYINSSKYKGYHLNNYNVVLDDDGCLLEYSKDKDGNYYLYVEIDEASSWFNNSYYIDTLNPKASERFIETTHEVYKKTVGDDFGKSIPAIFTDEPQVTHFKGMNFPTEKGKVLIAYTDKFDDFYKSLYKNSILDKFPEVIWQMPNNKPSQVRYRYFDTLSELFARGFMDVIGRWCDENDIMLTGHLMGEPTLNSQTAAIGEAMRSYRSMQLPGIDMLWDNREFSTAKQTQSAVHQYNRDCVLSELYGVTGYQFDFKSHKIQGDWQAALGIGVRVHHLTWVSMAGEAKRDYPASMGYHAPWYSEYSNIEDHFSRVNLALSKGKPQVRVGVVHPIESYWLNFGPNSQTGDIRRQMDSQFEDIISYLLLNSIDFDFISESLLPEQNACGQKGKFVVGEMAYDVVLLPNCMNIRRTTLDRLTEFADNGGQVISAGQLPQYIDGKLAETSVELSKFTNIPFEEVAIMNALEKYRDIQIVDNNGDNSDNLIYNMRNCDDYKWLFIAHAFETKANIGHESMFKKSLEEYTLTINGEYNILLYDTMDASIYTYPSIIDKGKTKLKLVMYDKDSLLLKLVDKNNSINFPLYNLETISDDVMKIEHDLVCDAIPLEPNVLLLDMAKYSLNNSQLSSTEEILRIDTKLRGELKYPLRVSKMAQPWTMVKNPNEEQHSLSLEYTINCDCDINETYYAMEDIDDCEIYLNDELLTIKKSGYYVDKAILKMPLPALTQGENTLKINRTFNERVNLEACYILGDFGVRVQGEHAVITKSNNRLRFGSITDQGYPFYGGNMKYKFKVKTKEGVGRIQVAQFKGMAVKVFVDGDDKGLIFKPPYKSEKIDFSCGYHDIELVVLGNRYNTFAGLHNTDTNLEWFGSNWWRTTGDAWSYAYNFMDIGIMEAPNIDFD